MLIVTGKRLEIMRSWKVRWTRPIFSSEVLSILVWMMRER